MTARIGGAACHWRAEETSSLTHNTTQDTKASSSQTQSCAGAESAGVAFAEHAHECAREMFGARIAHEPPALPACGDEARTAALYAEIEAAPAVVDTHAPVVRDDATPARVPDGARIDCMGPAEPVPPRVRDKGPVVAWRDPQTDDGARIDCDLRPRTPKDPKKVVTDAIGMQPSGAVVQTLAIPETSADAGLAPPSGVLRELFPRLPDGGPVLGTMAIPEGPGDRRGVDGRGGEGLFPRFPDDGPVLGTMAIPEGPGDRRGVDGRGGEGLFPRPIDGGPVMQTMAIPEGPGDRRGVDGRGGEGLFPRPIDGGPVMQTMAIPEGPGDTRRPEMPRRPTRPEPLRPEPRRPEPRRPEPTPTAPIRNEPLRYTPQLGDEYPIFGTRADKPPSAPPGTRWVPRDPDAIEQQHGARPGDDAWIRAAYVLEVDPWHGRRRSLSDDD